jgi:uncharacterized protein YjiS (DUF1127 family)
MSTTSSELRASFQPEFDLRHFSSRALKTIALWRARTRQRHQLRNLSAAQLADIGVSREAATAEARKSFWEK